MEGCAGQLDKVSVRRKQSVAEQSFTHGQYIYDKSRGGPGEQATQRT